MDREQLTLRGLAKREGDYWASIVMDFNVVGTGDTPEDAIRLSVRMTEAYIEEGCEAGKTIAELRRRVPVRVWVDYHLLHLWFRLFSHRNHKQDGGARPFERRAVLC